MDQTPRVYRPLNDSQRVLLDRLVRECAPRLMAYVRKLYGRGVDAEEVVAETFARATANIETLANVDRPDIYLLTVARNLCRDQFRRQRPEAISDERCNDLPHRHGSPAEIVGGVERQEALRSAVAALPDAFREVVVLRMTAELSFEEIAKLLHIPLGTALSRMHAAVGRLREALSESDESPKLKTRAS